MSLDLHLLTNLVTLKCSNAGLAGTLDVNGISTLTTLDCNTNATLTTLTLTGCTALVTLACQSCALDGLDVTTCTSLDTLDCYSNPFGTNHTLDLSNCAVLNEVYGYNCPGLWVVDMTNIGSMTGFINFDNCVNLTTLTTPDISNVDQDIRTTGCTSLGAWSFPSLLHVGGEIDFDHSGVVTVSLPVLLDIGYVSSGRVIGSTCLSLTTFSAPNCIQGGPACDLELDGCPNLTSVILTVWQWLGITSFSGCTSLASLSLPALTSVQGDFNANGCTNLSSFSAPLWVPTVGPITFLNDALNTASIDLILSICAPQAGSLVGQTIDLSGGTNLSHASWSAGALADETTLTTAGVIVLSNP